MLTAVDFDDEPQFTAGKIRKIGTNRQLSDKLVSVEPPIAQLIPLSVFCIIVRLTQ